MSPEKRTTEEQMQGIDYQMLEQMKANLTKKAQEAEKTLNQQIMEAKLHNEQLAGEVAQFSERLEELEQQLHREREKYQEISLRFHDYRMQMAHTVMEKDRAVSERDRQLEEYRSQIENFVQEREENQKEIATLRQKGERYDHIKKGLDQIRIQAELKAGKLVEEAQACARDAMDQLEDTATQLRQVKKEAQGQEQAKENRLEQFYDLLDAAVEKMTGMREQFFMKNKIPPEPAACSKAAEETPLDRMLKVMLGGNENGTENISGGGSGRESGQSAGGSVDSL